MEEKWYFTKQQLANTSSTKYGFNVDMELSHRQQAANLINLMGQMLEVYPFQRKRKYGAESEKRRF
jgi:cyclin T